MLDHPGTELQLLIKEKGLTQKAFASILGKKVSEVNELLKGKRNITIQRDYLLHQTLGTPIKYWILKQIDYDYSLLDVDEKPSVSPLEKEGLGEIGSHSERSEESKENGKSYNSPLSEEDLGEVGENQGDIPQNTEPSGTIANYPEISPIDKGDTAKQMGFETQETPIQKLDPKHDEDHQKRAKIFKSF